MLLSSGARGDAGRIADAAANCLHTSASLPRALNGDLFLQTTHRLLFLNLAAFVFATLFAGGNAMARNLKKLPIPGDDHDPLYVDAASIVKKDGIVHFKYVLDVPVFGEAYAVRRYRSNEMEATVDCDRQMFSASGVTAYAGVAATGNVTGIYLSSKEERTPVRIDMRKGSTTGYLARFLCPGLGNSAK